MMPINLPTVYEDSKSTEDEVISIIREKDSIQVLEPDNNRVMSQTGFSLTWNSRDDDTQRQFNPPEATGDHVVVHAYSTNELIQKSYLDFTPYYSNTVELEIPSDEFNPYTDPISQFHPDFEWFVFGNIEPDWIVTLTSIFTNGDCDFMAWPASLNSSTWSYSNNILGSSMNTGLNPELASFTWNYPSGILYVACYNSDRTHGWAEVNVFFDVTADTWTNGNQISYDTYNFRYNMTTPILYLGTSGEVLEFVAYHPGVQFNNFFAPNVTMFPPIDLGENRFNFSWVSSDRNRDDVNYYSVWLSSDGGYSYQMIEGNLTDSFFVWDSTGFLEGEYLIKVRAYSLDFVYRNYCTVDYPPFSYWPGDYGDSEPVEIGAGDIHSMPPGYFEVHLDSPDDITYIEHTTGNLIVWDPSFQYDTPNYVDYEVLRNETQWETGRVYPTLDEGIEVNIDGLQPGTHVFELQVGSRASDSVVVRVVKAEVIVDTFQSPWSQLIHYGAVGISVGSSFTIIMVIALTIRLRREYLSKLAEQATPSSEEV
jgi:hypothetical protein